MPCAHKDGLMQNRQQTLKGQSHAANYNMTLNFNDLLMNFNNICIVQPCI